MAIQLTGPLYVTGSITASAGFNGTASYANIASESNTTNFDVAGTIFHPPTAIFNITDSDTFTIKQIPISQSGLNIVNVNITSSNTFLKIVPIIYVDNFSGSAYTDTQIQYRNLQNSTVTIGNSAYYSSSVPYYYNSLGSLTTNLSLAANSRATDVTGIGHVVTDYEGTVYVGTINEESTYLYITSSFGNPNPSTLVVGSNDFYWDASWPNTIITGSQWLNVALNTNFYLTSSVNFNIITSSLPYYVQLSGSNGFQDFGNTSATSALYSAFCVFKVSGSGTLFSHGHPNNTTAVTCYLSASNIYVDAINTAGTSSTILVTSSYVDNTWAYVSYCYNPIYSVTNPWNIKTWYNGQPISSASFSPTSSAYANFVGKRVVGSKLDGTNPPASMQVGQFYSYIGNDFSRDLSNFQQFEFLNNLYNYGL